MKCIHVKPLDWLQLVKHTLPSTSLKHTVNEKNAKISVYKLDSKERRKGERDRHSQ